VTVYADSSVLIAFFHPDDEFALPVTDWVRKNVTGFLWNPVLRAEVRHAIRGLKTRYARVAWNALRAAENSGRLTMGREKLQDLFQEADTLSEQKAAAIAAGTWDYFHVAAALHTKADAFTTCDRLQAELASDACVKNLKFFWKE